MYYFITLLTLGCINSIMVVGLNLQYGFSGILNVSIYMYVAIGAYVAGITTMGHSTVPGTSWALGWTLPWYVGLLLGGLAAAALSAVVFALTVRRLRMDYLAIVTVASGFIIWNLINSYYPLFDGDTGLFGVPYITGNANLSSIQYNLVMLVVSGVVLLGCLWLSARIFRSPFGRVLRAIREDEVVANSFGRSTWKPQLWVFVIGCFMAGLSGALFIFDITSWTPETWLPLESFVIFAALVVGGSGNYWGAIVGGFFLVAGLIELTRLLPSFGNPAGVGALRLIVIGVAVILVLRYRPEGLIPERWLKWYRPSSSGPLNRIRPWHRTPAVALATDAAPNESRKAGLK